MSKCECWKNRCCQCLARVPYGSAAAAVIAAIGITVFCVYALRSTDATADLFQNTGVDTNQYVKDAMDMLDLVIYAITGGMAGIAVIVVVIGVLSTGETRLTLCYRYRARMCSRFAIGFFFFVFYVLTIVWFLISCALVIPSLFSTMIRLLCGKDYEQKFNSTCVDLTQYGLSGDGNAPVDICNENLKEFCKEGNDIWMKYLLTWAGAAMVVVAMVHALICVAANYAHIKDTTKATKADYEQVEDRTPDGVELKDYPS
ncbi:proteolipid protein DM beta-like [Glandiceps talaboti]